MRSALPLSLLLLAACASAPSDPAGRPPTEPSAPPPPAAAPMDSVGGVQARVFPVTVDLVYRAAPEAVMAMGWVLRASGPDARVFDVGVPGEGDGQADELTVTIAESGDGGSLVTVRSALADGLTDGLEDELVAPHVGAYLDALADLVTM